MSNRNHSVCQRSRSFTKRHVHFIFSFAFTFSFWPTDIKENIFYGSNKEILIKLIDMVNDVSVQDVSIANRKCRFSWERDILAYPTIYDHYSYSACFVECSMGVQVEFCNCTHHLMPKRNNGNAKICDIDGLICLTNNFGWCHFSFSMLKSKFNMIIHATENMYFLFYKKNHDSRKNKCGKTELRVFGVMRGT